MLLQTALAAETHMVEGLTLKSQCTVKVVSDWPSSYVLNNNNNVNTKLVTIPRN